MQIYMGVKFTQYFLMFLKTAQICGQIYASYKKMFAIVSMSFVTRISFHNLLLAVPKPCLTLRYLCVTSVKVLWGIEVWLIAPCWFNQQGAFGNAIRAS